MPRRRKLREVAELCGAKLPMSPGRLERAIRAGRVDRYLRRAGGRCRRRAINGTGRCKYHGGMSTGPVTDAGKAKVTLNLRRGLAR